MIDKLVIVHPSQRYDEGLITKPEIVKLANRYGSAQIFVLHNDDDYASYLERGDLIQKEHTKYGDITGQRTLRDILDDCATITLCGHTQDACHLNAYESLVGHYKRAKQNDMRMVLPTFAISSSECWDSGRSVRQTVTELQSPERIKIPAYFRPHQEGFLELRPLEIATLAVMQEYVKCLLTKGFSLEIEVDNRTVFRRQNGHPKRITLSLENNASLCACL